MSPHSELRVDTDTLRQAGTSLQQISAEFGEAGNNATEVAGLVGHDRLADAIRGFADKWNSKRSELKKSVDALATATTQIAQTFEEVDAELAKALDSDDSNTPAPNGSTSSTGSASSGTSTGDATNSGSTGSTPNEGTGDFHNPGAATLNDAYSSWRNGIASVGSDWKHPAGEAYVIESKPGTARLSDTWAQCADVTSSYAKSLFGNNSDAAFNNLGFNGDTAFLNASDSYFEKLPPSTAPQPGDILSWGGGSTYGHVAVVDHIGDDGRVYTIEQDGYWTYGYGPYYGSYTVGGASGSNSLLGVLRPRPEKIV
ncbi:MAG: CHAP domain-containing protein [Propionibacteriaceae bacterium]|jgi:hypothetical protein|nr:CHAP domain-containing protein [Propionibacteriaceae bacterium]